MKNRLLLTTALVGVAFAMPAMAAAEPIYINEANKTIADGTVYESLKNEDTTNQNAAAVTVDTEGSVTIGDNVHFNGNSSVNSGGAMKSLGGFEIGDGAEFRGNTSNKGGGALYIRQSDKNGVDTSEQAKIGNNATFDGNKATGDNWYGGAIAAEYVPGGLQIGNGATFTNNEAANGGAIAIWSDGQVGETKPEGSSSLILGDGATFANNKATSYGGALHNNNAFVKVGNGATFSHNTAATSGAIHNTDSKGMVIGDNATFTENSATEYAGAILNQRSELTIGNNATFTENSSGEGHSGGAIVNDSYGKVVLGNGANFTGNKSGKSGGAVYQYQNKIHTDEKSSITIGEGAIFTENTAKANGGAIASYGGDTTVGDNVQFVGNEAENAGGAIYNETFEGVEANFGKLTNALFDSNSAKLGGAVYNKGNLGDLNGVTFANNTAETNGGAILNSNGGKIASISNSIFKNNKSINGGGGAIYNKAGEITTISKTVFEGNVAEKGNGGAIFNGGSTGATISLDDVQFIGNSAENGAGGAISASGITNIANATFTGNTASVEGGAINLDGSAELTLEGTNTFSGNKLADGTLNDINNDGSIVVSQDASLTLDGGISGDGSLKLEVNTTLNVKQGVTEIANEVSSEGTTVNVTLKGGESSIDLNQIFTNKANEDSLDNIKLGENSLFDFVQDDEDASVWNANQKSADEVAAALGATGSEAAAVLALVSGGADTGNEAFDSVAEALNDAAQNGNGAAAKEAAKLGADANPIVRTVETDLHNMVFAAVTDELNGASGAMAEGKSSGDAFKQVKAWIRGMFNHADKEATSKASGFDANIYGVAMGIDKQIDHAVKVGAGYAYSQTDVSAHGRDTDVDTHTAFVYGRYQPADWYVNTVVAYNWSDYDEKKSVLGSNANAKYDVESLGVQSMFGYETKLGGYDVTPEAGLRYVHISQDAYHDRLGNRTGSNDSDILTAVIGTKVAKNYALDSETVIRPELKAAVTYDLIDDGNNANVVLANGAAYRVNGEKLDRLGFELGAKVATDVTDNLEISAGWEGRFRKDYNDQTAMLNAKYKF